MGGSFAGTGYFRLDRGESLVEFVKFGLEQFLVGHLGLVLGDHGRGKGTTESIFHDFLILGGTEQHSDGWVFVAFSVITVERFEIEIELAEVFGFEATRLEFEGDEGVEATMEKEQIERKVLPAHLQGIFGSDIAKVAPQLGKEAPEVADQRAVQVGFIVLLRKPEEFERIGIFKYRLRSGI